MNWKCIKCGIEIESKPPMSPEGFRGCIKCYRSTGQWYKMEEIEDKLPDEKVINTHIPEINDSEDDEKNFDEYLDSQNKSILEEANDIINGPRQDDYGSPKDNYEHIALIYNAITKQQITPKEIIYIMIATKLARQQNKEKRDNLVDAAGYIQLLDMI